MPKCITTWRTIFDQTVSVKEVFLKLPVLYDRKYRNLHWNTIHRAIFSEKRLQRMNKSNGMCKVCCQKEETLTHLFYDCNGIQPIWRFIEGIIESVLLKEVLLSIRHIFFCVQRHTHNLNCDEIFFCNMLILTAKFEIWKHRNKVKFDVSKKLSVYQLSRNVHLACKNYVNVLLDSDKKQQLKNTHMYM